MTSDLPGRLGTADRPEPSVLGGREPALTVASDGGRPFRLESETAVAAAHTGAGPVEVRVRGDVVASRIGIAGLKPVHALVAPGSARRECVGPSGSVMEHWLLPPTLPVSVVQWHIPPGARPSLRVELPTAPGATVRIGPDRTALIATEPAHPDRHRALLLWGSSSGWASGPGDGGTIASADLSAPRATLLVALGTEKEIDAAMAGAGHLAAHEIRSGARTEGLVMDTGIDLLDEALHWAAHRVSRSLMRGAPVPADSPDFAASRFWTIHGALVSGALEAAGAGLGIPADSESAPDAAWPAAALDVLLAARLAAAGGRTSWSLRHARALLDRGTEPILAPTREAEGLWRLALRETADALRYAMPDADLARLRGVRVSVAGTDTGRRSLPMAPVAGGPPRHFLEAAATGAGAVPPATDSIVLSQALLDYSAWYRDPDAAWSGWRRALAEGLMRGPEGAGTWDSAADSGDRAPVAGVLLTSLAHGLLGYAPDAPSGRLNLSPRVPTHLTDWSVRGLRLGDASLGVRYAREGETHRFDIEPDFARVPPVVVLEPKLPGSRLVECRVDDEVVAADSAPIGARVAPRLQVAIDGPRRVTFTTD